MFCHFLLQLKNAKDPRLYCSRSTFFFQYKAFVLSVGGWRVIIIKTEDEREILPF